MIVTRDMKRVVVEVKSVNGAEWEIPVVRHSLFRVESTATNELLTSDVKPLVGNCTHTNITHSTRAYQLDVILHFHPLNLVLDQDSFVLSFHGVINIYNSMIRSFIRFRHKRP